MEKITIKTKVTPKKKPALFYIRPVGRGVCTICGSPYLFCKCK